jgi:hypothetical protein
MGEMLTLSDIVFTLGRKWVTIPLGILIVSVSGGVLNLPERFGDVARGWGIDYLVFSN